MSNANSTSIHTRMTITFSGKVVAEELAGCGRHKREQKAKAADHGLQAFLPLNTRPVAGRQAHNLSMEQQQNIGI